MSRKVAQRRKAPIKVLTLAISLSLASTVMAQESQKAWAITQPAGQSGSYNTQQDAVAAFQAIPDEPWEYVNQIKDQQVADNGDVTLNYWMGKEQPADPDWTYQSGAAGAVTTEEAAVAALIAQLNSLNPSCPAAATATPATAWTPLIPQYAGRYEQRTYSTQRMAGSNTAGSPCHLVDGGDDPMFRTRRLQCPNPYTDWTDEDQACVNNELIASIVSKTEECEAPPTDGTSIASNTSGYSTGLKGNPCNIKTGDKYQIESDFNLGWISFQRYYHSVMSVGAGGFGNGWTHSHSTRLAISPNTIGLLSGSGYQVRFKKSGTDYWAADNTGERITASGSNWVLYRASSIATFDAKGRLLSQQFELGTLLTYTYDVYDRLDTIMHNTGRSIQLHYATTNADAPITSITSAGTALASYTYTVQGQVETATYPGSETRTYHYEDARFPMHLTGVTGEDNARFSTFSYDAKGRAISSQHAGGADGVTLSYTPLGGAIVTDALGYQTNFGLTSEPVNGPPRKVGEVSDSRGAVSQTYYSEATDYRRRLASVMDRKGVETQHTYAEANDAVTGQLARSHFMKEAAGLAQERTSEQRVDVASNRLILSKVGNRETRIARNARLQPATVTVRDTVTSNTQVTTQAYCEAADVAAVNSTCPTLGLPKTINGPRTDVNDIASVEYYGSDDTTCATNPLLCSYRKGDVSRTINAVGQSTLFMGYDPFGRPLSVTDINGVVTDYEYNPRGWRIASKVRGNNNAVETDDQITRVDYWPTGLVKKVTLPDGTFISYAYNAARQLTDVTDNAGDTIHYTVDLAGNRTQEDTKNSSATVKHTLSRVFNALGQLQIAKNAYQDPTQFTYDASGNLDTTTDALARTLDRDRDALNRLSRTLQYVNNEPVQVLTQYNDLDQVTQITDPKNLVTQYTYDGFGNQTALNSPDTGGTIYSYDAAGNRKTKTDARGIVATYGYDALNRLTTITYPAAAQNVSYLYDTPQSVCAVGETFGKGRLAKVTDESGSTQYCYDRFGALVRKVQITNGNVFTLRYGYNPQGQLSSITYPDGAIVTYQRNAQGRINQVTAQRSFAGSTGEIVASQISYNPFGASTGWVFGNGRGFVRASNLNYQVTTLSDISSGGLSATLKYDAVGNVMELGVVGGVSPVVRFDVDALDRLTALRDGPTGTAIESYTYDVSGNRKTAATSAGTKVYEYPASSHRLTQAGVGEPIRTYDANGSATSIGNDTFAYNDAGRMSQLKQGGVVRMAYLYNGMGEQVQRTTGSTHLYRIFDQSGNWIGEYDSTGSAVQQVIWLDDLPIGLFVGGSTQQQVHYIEADHLGAPRVVIDPVRNVAVWNWSMSSEAFGNSPPNQDPDSDSVPFVFNMRFPGQLFEPLSGLSYNYYRDYEPLTGRYIQSDPIGLRGGVASFAYAGNRPSAVTDRLGLFWVVPFRFWLPAPPNGPLSPERPAGYDPDVAYPSPSSAGLQCSVEDVAEILVFAATGILVTGPERLVQFASSDHPGFWDGVRGSEEWGRRNNVDKDEARRRFHEIKQDEKGQGGGRGLEKYLVNPQTGEVMNPAGDIVGDLGE